MDLLGFLKEKKVEQNTMVHPFVHTNHTFKYLYCFGLGVLTCGHMKAMTELNNPFQSILKNINLSENYRDRIIIDINNNFDYKINDVFLVLDTKERQYTFAADLYMLSNIALWSQSYCEKVVEVYLNIFKFSKEEHDFFRQFITASKKNNLEQARSVYQAFVKNGYYISYKLLIYMFHNFVLEERFGDLLLEKGETFVIDKPTKIKGDIYVKNGSSLTIDGGDLKISGKIIVDGGKLVVKQANIFVIECSQPTLFQVSNTAVVSIDSSIIDCNFKCGVIHQENGHLLIIESKLNHTKISPCIDFKGRSISISGSNIEDCLNGGILVQEEAVMKIDSSSFYNCEAEHGGAIFFDSLYDGIITNCIFKNCRAKFIAGAVYFANKKYGQEVIECEFIHNIPEENVICNHYLDKNNTYQ